jgi:hypothetical protein
MGRTVRKNAYKLQDEIFSKARNMTLHTLDNGFRGQKIRDPNMAKKSYRASKSAYLYHEGNGKYRIHYHSNKFIKFQSVPPPARKRKTKKKK